MTYCVGIKLNAGLVFLSDSRTNAGVDHISTFRKMIVYEQPGDRFMVLLSAGNLSHLAVGARDPADRGAATTATTAADHDLERHEHVRRRARARLGGAPRVRPRRPRRSSTPASTSTSSMIFGGQIKGEAHAPVPGLFGRQLHRGDARDAATSRSANRSTASRCSTACSRPTTPLDEAAKCALVSMDSTMKSNLSVGLPLDLVVYEANRFETDQVVCIDDRQPLLPDDAQQLGPEAARGVRQHRGPGLGRRRHRAPAARCRRRATAAAQDLDARTKSSI